MASQVDIANFIDICGTDRDTAAKFLKSAGYNVDAAVGNFFDNPSRFDGAGDVWDESEFHVDRSGGADATAYQGMGAFNIHSQGDEASAFASNVPTGAPSRVNTPLQEEGYIGHSGEASAGQYFGPTRQPYYDPSTWALTTSHAAVAEVWPDVSLPHRIRAVGQPAFIKPLSDSDLLPSLLTILGACDATRHALSAHNRLWTTQYGWHLDWWSGTPISSNILIDASAGDREAQEIHRGQQEFVWEVQRLMMALERSRRSYVSAESLTKQSQWERRPSSVQINTSITHFATAWEDAVAALVDEPKVATSMFQTRVGQQQPGSPDTFDTNYEFDFTVPHADNIDSLYDILDANVWGVDPNGESDEQFFIEEAGNVLIFRIRQLNAAKRGLDVDIPLTLHLDRYMRKNAQIMKDMRRATASHKQQLQAVAQAKAKLETFHFSGKTGQVSDLFAQAIGTLETDETERQSRKNEGEDVSMTSSPERDSDDELLEDLRALRQTVDARLTHLSQQQEQLKDTLAAMKARFKGLMSQDPGTDFVPETEYSYELRGASTGDNRIYTLFNGNPASPDPPEWWDISYIPSPSFACEQTNADRILQSIKNDSRTVMLVYIKTAFMSPEPTMVLMAQPSGLPAIVTTYPWPPGLVQFIDQDNDSLTQELAEFNRSNTSNTEVSGGPPDYDNSMPQGGFVPDYTRSSDGTQLIDGVEMSEDRFNEW